MGTKMGMMEEVLKKEISYNKVQTLWGQLGPHT